jgi:hypothetical protein
MQRKTGYALNGNYENLTHRIWGITGDHRRGCQLERKFSRGCLIRFQSYGSTLWDNSIDMPNKGLILSSGESLSG